MMQEYHECTPLSTRRSEKSQNKKRHIQRDQGSRQASLTCLALSAEIIPWRHAVAILQPRHVRQRHSQQLRAGLKRVLRDERGTDTGKVRKKNKDKHPER